MISIRKVLPLLLVVVICTIILICPGIATHSLSVSYFTNIIFIVELLISLFAMIAFIFCIRNYPTEDDIQANCGMNRRDMFKVYLFNDKHTNTVKDFLTQNAIVVAVYLFGGSSIALNVSSIYYNAQCVGFFASSTIDHFTASKEAVHLTTSVIKMIVTIVEIPFLHHLSKITYAKRNSLVATGSILILFGVETAKWVYGTLYVTVGFKIFSIDTTTEPFMNDLMEACLNHSSIAEVYSHQTLEDAFWPCYILFCFVAIEILIRIYFIKVFHTSDDVNALPSIDAQTAAINKLDELCNSQNLCLVPSELEMQTDDKILSESIDPWDVPNNDEEDDENSRLINPSTHRRVVQPSNNPASPSPTGNDIQVEIVQSLQPDSLPPLSLLVRMWSYIISVCSPTLALIVGVTEALLIKYYLLHSAQLPVDPKAHGYINKQYFDNHCAIPLIAFSILCDGIPMLIVTCHCCYILKKFPHQRPYSSGVRISIILASIGIFILNAFFIIVSIITLTDQVTGAAMWTLTLIESLITWPQYYIQIVLIYLGLKRLPDAKHSFFPTLQGAFSYLAMSNLMHWLINTFMGTDYLIERLHDMEQWDTLVHLFVPLLIYFYFLCTFILLDVKRLMKEAERPRQRWRLELQVANLRPHMR